MAGLPSTVGRNRRSHRRRSKLRPTKLAEERQPRTPAPISNAEPFPTLPPPSCTCTRPSPTQTLVCRRPAVRRKPLNIYGFVHLKIHRAMFLDFPEVVGQGLLIENHTSIYIYIVVIRVYILNLNTPPCDPKLSVYFCNVAYEIPPCRMCRNDQVCLSLP